MINYLLLPGQIENCNFICDAKDFSLSSVPDELKELITVIQENYKCRLFKVYILNLESFGGILWKLIKKMLGEDIEKKILVVRSDNNYKDLFNSIHRSQIEK